MTAIARRDLLATGLAALALHGCSKSGATEELDETFSSAADVTIRGYDGDAMEPSMSRDGRLLLFNNRNEAPQNTDLHWSERIDDLTFAYRGKIEGTNTAALEGTPSMDRNGELYFVSTRSYDRTFSTLYRAHFAGGKTSVPELIPGVSRRQPGWVNFDLEISADGRTLYFVDSWFGRAGYPQSAGLVIATRQVEGFRRLPQSEALLASVNGGGLVYAPAISADECELCFTRVQAITADATPAIFRSTRAATDQPFGTPRRIAAITGFAEGPTFSPNADLLYFHARRENRFVIRSVRKAAS